jgi:hypothetical protein
MKKLTTIIICLVAIALGVFVLIRVWHVFGFWTIIWTVALSAFSSKLLNELIVSRKEKDKEIIYNPKEWPKYVSAIVSFGIGYYLYTIISKPETLQTDFTFGMIYLSLTTFLPVGFAIFKITRDRNDYVVISDKTVKYRDNLDLGEFHIEDIKSVESSGGIKLTLKNGETHIIKTAQMNFNSREKSGAIADIKKKLSKEIID